MEGDAGAEEGLGGVRDAAVFEVEDAPVFLCLRLLPELLLSYEPEKPSFLQLFVDDDFGAEEGLDDVDDVGGDEERGVAGP